MLKHLLLCCIFMGLATESISLSILLIETVPSTSHHVWAMTLVRELLRRGHHVHVVSIHEAKVQDELAQNLTYAVFENVMKELHESEDYEPAEWKTLSVLYVPSLMYEWMISACDKITETKAAKELFQVIKNVEFDVIVHDVTLKLCLFKIWEVAKGKPPVVGFLPFGSPIWLKDYIGGSSYPNVRPYMHLANAKPVGLWERTCNTFYYIMDDLHRYYYFLPGAQQSANRYARHEIKPLRRMEQTDINIILLNSHSTFEPGIPLPPNVIEIGGMHAQVVEPIADETILKFLDEAENGVIVISLGTNVNWKAIGTDKLKAVILALSKLKQRVIWKLDVDVPFEIPKNIMIVKWLPQGDVLAHKNVKVVWTHGGLLSTHEAIWKGVPVLVMPFFMDQKPNAEMLVAKGVAIRLDVTTLTVQTVSSALEEILYNESYTKNMKRLSSEFRDRPIPPLDLAIWGIEYAVRHPQSALGSPIRFQSWIEQNLIDIYAVFFFIFVVILLIVYAILKMLSSFCYNCIYVTHKRKSKQS